MSMEQTEPSRKNWVEIPPALKGHLDRAYTMALKVSALTTAANAINDDDRLRDLRIEIIQELNALTDSLTDALDTPERFAQVAA